jgi:hypothetical protein
MACNTITGFTADAADNFIFDSGVLFKNVTNPASGDYSALTKENFIGATTGGVEFTAAPSLIDLFEDVDGAYGKFKGGDVIETWEISLSTSLLEATSKNLAMAIGPADITDNTDMTGGGKTITPSNCIEDKHYATNICLFVTKKGYDKPVVIEMTNVINGNGFSLTTNSKNKGTIEVELSPRFDLANPDVVPFKIHLPEVTK